MSNTRSLSENPDGADNQQERLIAFRGWVTGFVDGEGCFSIGFTRQPGGCSRTGYKTGFQVSHELAVTQGAQSVSCLNDMCEFFGVGQVVVNRRTGNHKEDLYRYVVRKRRDLIETIIPFFERNPLRSSKRQNFEKFVHCVELIDAGRHLTREGLIEIAQITQTMNRQKPRTELIRILRDHTPNIHHMG